MRRPALLPFLSFLFLATCVWVDSTAHAQEHRLTAEGGFGIVGQGAQRVPSGRLGYALQVVPHLDLTADARFSHIQTYDNSSLTQRADLTYLDASVGLALPPSIPSVIASTSESAAP